MLGKVCFEKRRRLESGGQVAHGTPFQGRKASGDPPRMSEDEPDPEEVSRLSREALELEYWGLRRELRNRLPTEGFRHLLLYIAPLALGTAAFVAGPQSEVAFYFAGTASVLVALWGLLHRMLPFSWQGGHQMVVIMAGMGLAAGVAFGLLLKFG